MNSSIISTWLLLLATAAHIQNINGFPYTSLMKAVRANDINLVSRLLANGADAKATNNRGKNALMYAAEYGNEKSVELLLPNSNVKATNNDGETALDIAKKYGYDQITRLLQQ